MPINLINLVYSGPQSADQSTSFGGFPSQKVIPTTKNNLFADATSGEATQGSTDYRCIYVFNEDNNIKYDIAILSKYLNDIGSNIQLGLFMQNSVQRLTFSPVPTSGNFKLSYSGIKSDKINWDNNPNVFAANLEDALDCSVTVISPSQFNITFIQSLGNKALSLSITDNNLIPATIPIFTQNTIGSPINTVAPDTGLQNLAPTGIPFSEILENTPIGTLYPSEGFPIWVKRIIPPNSPFVADDGFSLKFALKGVVLF